MMSFKRSIAAFTCAAALAFGLAGGARAQSAPSLTTADVDKVVGQALAEAAARNATNGAIAVVDRVGNVLGVYALDPANIPLMTITSGRGIPADNGLEAVNILPATFGALAKALTGAYLSSSGNAFTTRTASQIVQEHFNPGERNTPSGPLFGVQFSQLACSDLMRFGEATGTGPRRSPLGLSADMGGLPLYKNGQVVGGVGVLFDGIYGLDLKIDDYDRNLDELIAVAAQQSYEPPVDITSRITADGKFLTYTDVDKRDLKSSPTSSAAAVNLTNYIAIPGYTPAGRRDGVAFGTQASGVRAEGRIEYPAVDAWILDDGLGNNRYAPRASLAPAVTGGGLAAAEVRTIMTEALKVAFAARAQIRRPLGSFAQVTISVVDAESNILAVARTPDAPMFGTDVSLQKARSAMFMSRTTTAAELRAVPATTLIPGALSTAALGTYVDAFQALVGPTALADGTAYADRTIGLLARPYYPDGIQKRAHGPFSKPFSVWSPFNIGMQLDLVLPDIVARLDGSPPPPQGCTALPQSAAAGPGPGPTRLANGLQIFPGSVPIYRGTTLIGGLGVSGDGVDQDDMISFLGLHNAGQVLNSGVGNAPKDKRADILSVGGLTLRYVQCPFSPFNNSREQNVCSGK
jgi:uncharacterized protein GlcG (DUF336 family)